MMAPVEHVSNVVDLIDPDRRVPAGGPQVGVPEPGCRPVGAQRVRVREPVSHTGGEAVAPDEIEHGLGRQRLRRLAAAMASEPDEQRLLIAQATGAAGERMRRKPGLERGKRFPGDRELAFGAAFAADVGSGPRGYSATKRSRRWLGACARGSRQAVESNLLRQGSSPGLAIRPPDNYVNQTGAIGCGPRLRAGTRLA